MIRNRYIKNGLSVWLLSIFILSNTPIHLLHTLFADHIDYKGANYDSNSPQLHTTGIECHYDTNVVTAPYTCADVTLPVYAAPVFDGPDTAIINGSYASVYLHFSQRGPPAGQFL